MTIWPYKAKAHVLYGVSARAVYKASRASVEFAACKIIMSGLHSPNYSRPS